MQMHYRRQHTGTRAIDNQRSSPSRFSLLCTINSAFLFFIDSPIYFSFNHNLTLVHFLYFLFHILNFSEVIYNYESIWSSSSAICLFVCLYCYVWRKWVLFSCLLYVCVLINILVLATESKLYAIVILMAD